jgi:CBS domain-containing protein
MALNSEQHNALVYANPTSPEEAERAEQWFDAIAEGVNKALEECGFRPSEFVARDPRWRQPLRYWKQTYRSWILQADKAAPKPVPVFFDLRTVYGDADLVDELKQDIIDALNVSAMDESRRFLQLQAADALEKSRRAPFLRKVLEKVNEPRAFDVRESGIVPIVNAARVLALELRYLESTNTFDRLRHAAAALPELAKAIEQALESYQYLVDFRLESQLRAVEAGDPPVNQIDAASLNRLQQRLLRNVFGKASHLLDALAKRYDLSRGWLS